MIRNFVSKNYALIILAIIIGIAAFLRLYRIEDYLIFLGDEGRDVLVVRQILHGHLTFLGPRASAGDFFLGPIYYYFMAPFLFLSNFNPVGPAIMVALLATATVFLIYKMGKEFFGTRAGLFASLLYAVSFLVVAYSRSSWNPNVMPFFSVLALYTAYKGIEKKKLFLMFISGILLGIAMQLHYLTVFLGGILFFYIFLTGFSKNKLPELLKKYAAVFAGFLIGLSPFLAFEIKNGFPNIRTIFNFIFFSGNVAGSGKFEDIVGSVFFRVFGRLITAYPSPESVSPNTSLGIAFWYYFTLVLAFASIGLLTFQLLQKLKNQEKGVTSHLLILLWIGLGILFFGLYKKAIYDYYFGFMFPAPFLVVGNLFANLWNRNLILKLIVVGIMGFLLYINYKGDPLHFAPNRQYRQVEMISKFILNKAGGKPYNFALITGGNSDHAYRYIFVTNNKPPVTILGLDSDPQRKSVTDQLFVVCEENPCHPLGHSLWEVAGFGRAEITDEWQVSVLKVYKLVHYKEK